MLYIAPSIILDVDQAATLKYPAILWNNLVTPGGIAADEEDADFPATNLSNSQTSSLWKSGSTADQDIVFDVVPDQPIDGIGIARHNFGSGVVGVKIYGITAEPGAVFELLADLAPGDDDAVFAIVDGGYYVQIKISLEPGAIEPQAGVVYVGTCLRLVKGIIPGFAPPADALQVDMLQGLAENGDFLGNVIVSERRATSVPLRPLPGDWYRTNIRPFFEARAPFFFAWSPVSFPDEASFSKFDGNPSATTNYGTGTFDVSFSITGLAL